jgi:16S rRNA (guanine(966)-N(2))-methyltransferase RsmD
MRITGGIAKGRAIEGPMGPDVRPTGSKVRQALFNIIRSKVEGAFFLDLFAGTGLMGIEALSRGAAALTVVEENRRYIKAIESNLKTLGFQADLVCMDVRKALGLLDEKSFDLIFADPPYKSSFAIDVVQGVDRYGLMKDDGVLMIEHDAKLDMPEVQGKLQRFDKRNYGQTILSFYS